MANSLTLPPRPPITECRTLKPGEKPTVRARSFGSGSQDQKFSTGRYKLGYTEELTPSHTMQSGVRRHNGGVRGGKGR